MDQASISAIERLSAAVLASGRVALCGIGNPDRGDDAAGVAVIRAVFDSLGLSCDDSAVASFASGPSRGALLVDAITVPENYVEEIIAFAPGTVVFVDCANLNSPGAGPGAVRVFGADALPSNATASTHSIPLAVLVAIISSKLPSVSFLIAGVQPASVEFGAEMSAPVAESCAAISAALVGALRQGPSENAAPGQ